MERALQGNRLDLGILVIEGWFGVSWLLIYWLACQCNCKEAFMVVALSALHTLLYLCENRQNLFVYWLGRFIVIYLSKILIKLVLFDVLANKAKVLFFRFYFCFLLVIIYTVGVDKLHLLCARVE